MKIKKPKIAIILNGCGYLDGSDIEETVLLMYQIRKQNADFDLYSTNTNQKTIYDYSKKIGTKGERNIRDESCRIYRHEIYDMNNFDASEIDGLIIPGESGISKNLSDFSIEEEKTNINGQIVEGLKAVIELKKPIGLVGMSAFVLVKYFEGATISSGKDLSDLDGIVNEICWQIQCESGEIVTDPINRLISSNGNLIENASILDVAIEMEHLVNGLIEFINT